MANIVELREMSNEKLEEMLENAREEMFNLRFQHAARRISDPTRIRTVRRELAQLQTVLHNRAMAVDHAAQHPEIAPLLSGQEWDASAQFAYESSEWNVAFNVDGAEVANAAVDLNRKRPRTRRAREAKAWQVVKRVEIR